MLPFVSICTPTFNRRPFFPVLFQMFKNQTYPKNRMEWIIVDDGTDKVEDIVKQSGIPQIKYVSLDEKMTLGKKRNLMHSYCKGSIIIYVDDDDYFPPERVSHSVEKLLTSKNGEMIAGSSELYLYFKDIGMYKFGPYGDNHATAGTFAFKKELLENTAYDNDSCLAEEKHFLKGYTIPMIQLDSTNTILVFPHEHNTFDKNTLLTNGASIHILSDKTVENFIKGENEENIRNFFIKEMHQILKEYNQGNPIMKPDVLKQLNVMKQQKDEMEEKMQNEKREFDEFINKYPQYSPIVIKQENKSDIILTNAQTAQILQEQQNLIQELMKQNEIFKLTIEENKTQIQQLQNVILELK
jgi:glycosyltransferase involved in cell wall biosynthesis